MPKHLHFFLLFLSFFAISAIAQETNLSQDILRSCGFDPIRQELLQDSDYLQREIELENKLDLARQIIRNQKLDPNAPQALNLTTVYTIPVVVHVFHKGEALGSGTNISDAQIISSINHLTQVYRGQTAGNSVDFKVEFKLAKRDPNCNPTNGIVRINASSVSGYSANGIQYPGTTGSGVPQSTLLDMSRWPTSQYLNIWVVSEISGSGAIGYAYTYNPSFNYSGAVILYNNIGYDPGNPAIFYNGDNSTVIHEIGHYLNLRHTFQGGSETACPPNANPNTDNDGCPDTEPHKEAYNCPSSGSTNSCTGNAWLDANTRKNYMSYFICMDRLTNDQKTRSRIILEGSDIVQSQGANPPGPSYTPPVSACSIPNGTNIGSLSGVLSVELNGTLLSSGNSGNDGGNLDLSNSRCKFLEIDASVSNILQVKVNSSNTHQLGVWIDWNDDGDFNDEAEQQYPVTQGISAGTTVPITLTYPTNIPYGDHVRLRIITDLRAANYNVGGTIIPVSPISSACFNNLKFGQSEDYSIYVLPNVVTTSPEISVTPTSHNFGNVLQGATATRTFTINNTGTANLTLSNLTIPAGFTLVSTFGSTTVAAGGSTTFTIGLNTTTLGVKSGNLTFNSNDADEGTITIALSGTVVAPEIVVSELSYNFGNVLQGATATRTFTIQNTGTAALSLSNLTIPTGFTLVSTFGSTTVAAGGSTTFTVGLNTTTLGAKSGNLTFNSNDADEGTITIALSGTVVAPEIVVSELSYNFGNILQGATATRTFTINNTGTANLTLSNLTIPAGFTMVSSFGSMTVVAGGSTTFTVGLNTTTLGAKSGNITFNSNDADEGTITIALSGTVVAPEIEVSDLTHDFGSVLQGATATKTFTINNTGTANLTLSNPTIPAGFTLTSPLGTTTVAAGGSTTFTVGLNTTTLGAKSGNVTFNSNDADEGTITIVLSGTVVAPEIEVSDLTHDFGSVLQGATATKTFTIENIGTADLNLSNLIIPVGFTLVSTFGSTTVAAGGSTTFIIGLDTNSLGTKSGDLTFDSDDLDEGNIVISLVGEVVSPEIEVSELSFDFGNKLQGDFESKTFIISNIGTSTLNLTNLIVPTGFVLVDTFGSSSIGVGESTTFTIKIDETAIGERSGVLTFETDDLDEGTVLIDLEGIVRFNPRLLGNLTKVYKKSKHEIGISFYKEDLGDFVSLKIYDNIGKLVYQEEGVDTSNLNYTLPIYMLKKGNVYFITISGTKTISQKFIHF